MDLLESFQKLWNSNNVPNGGKILFSVESVGPENTLLSTFLPVAPTIYQREPI